MMESGSAMTSASSLSTRGRIPSGRMDLWDMWDSISLCI